MNFLFFSLILFLELLVLLHVAPFFLKGRRGSIDFPVL